MTKSKDEPLSPEARVFQLPGTYCCVVTIIGFKTNITPHHIVPALKLNVSKHPRFSSKLSDDGRKWIKTEVNVDDHVYVPDIDLEEIGEDGESFVNDYISHLTTLPLDKTRPLWDIHILNVKTCYAESIVVTRTHHSLGDGMSLMSLLVASTQKTSDPETLPTVSSLKPRKTVSSHSNKNWLLRWVFAVWLIVRLIWNTIVDLALLFATMLFLKDSETVLKDNSRVESSLKRFSHRSLSLDDIKNVKKAMNNMTINDVLLGVTQAALCRYLNETYGKLNAKDGSSIPNQNNIPSGLRVRICVAVNVRSDIGIQPLGAMMAKGSRYGWGNRVGFIAFPCSIQLQTDPLVFLTKAKSVMDRKKHSLHALLGFFITNFIVKIFGPKAAAALIRPLILNTTTCVSNLMGPIEEVCFLGHPISYLALTNYSPSQHALVIHFLSYAEKMVVMLAVDPTVITDPHKLCDHIEESLKDMKTAVSERGLLKDATHYAHVVKKMLHN